MGQTESTTSTPSSTTAVPGRPGDGNRRPVGEGSRSPTSARPRSPHHVRPPSLHHHHHPHHPHHGSAGLGLFSAATPTASAARVSDVYATNVFTAPLPARPRAVTAAAAAPHHSLAYPVLDALPHSHKSDSGTMGNTDSKPVRPPSRANTIHIQPVEPPRTHAYTPEPQPSVLPPPPRAAAPPSPPPSSSDVTPSHPSDVFDKEEDAPGYSESPYSLPPADYSRPPRLPLPIEEEVHTPGSPIITPQDVQTTLLEQTDVEGGALPRKTSVLSSTTVDDDDVGDNEAFAPDVSQWGEVRVPTKLEWNGSGEKIFVTGTFCNWEKKVKLHKHKDRYGFSAMVNLRPGTHHVKFLVDGEMMTSNDLPTTVDWTNILVNYIEIVAPMPATTGDEETEPPAPTAPMPIPGAALTAGQVPGADESSARPRMDGADVRVAETEKETETVRPSTLEEVEPQGDPIGPITEPQKSGSAATPMSIPPPSAPSQSKPEPKPTPAPPKQKIPRPKYTNQIPDFLIDLDNYSNPEDERFQRAQRVAGTLPAPPSLPMFLSKSILNGATPHKDDASVLIMPNHTVLNHLATSSIKSGVLATSGTTRYKRKFLTTIMYKPTSDDG